MMDCAEMPAPARRDAVSSQPVAPWFTGIQARFRDSILDRVMTFELLKKDIESGGDAQLALEEIAGLAHRVAGVAETLGYPRSGILAAEVEECILDGQSDALPPAETWLRLQPVLDLLLDELEGLLDD